MCYLFWPFVIWFRNTFWQTQTSISSYLASKFLQLLDLVEFSSFTKIFPEYLRTKSKEIYLKLFTNLGKFNFSNPNTTLAVLAIAILLGFILIFRFSQPLQQLRFARSDSYQTLLESWQILLGKPSKITFYSSIVASISSLAATTPIQTIRFFSPILGIFLVFIFALTVWQLTNQKSIGLIVSYILGAYTFSFPIDKKITNSPSFLEIINDYLEKSMTDQIFGGETTLAVIVAFLAIISWCQVIEGRQNLTFKQNFINSLVCLFLLALTFPRLLIPTFLTMAILLICRPLALLTFSFSLASLVILPIIKEPTQILSKELIFILPIVLTLFVAIFCQLINSFLNSFTKKYNELILVLFFVILASLFLPSAPKFQYLEYDIAARKALEISEQYPKKQWLIVAPVEQLASSYGQGWYQDLAEFVEKNQEKAINPDFYLSSALETFIFVEKKPFTVFDSEPLSVPFATLTDPTYSYYRSLAGRASLEQQALTLCETYRKLHPETKIYYEDEVLRIYYIQKIEVKLR
ncbi:MAG: hypothetical protein WAQ98_29445 [Blastocatellia bacterium]